MSAFVESMQFDCPRNRQSKLVHQSYTTYGMKSCSSRSYPWHHRSNTDRTTHITLWLGLHITHHLVPGDESRWRDTRFSSQFVCTVTERYILVSQRENLLQGGQDSASPAMSLALRVTYRLITGPRATKLETDNFAVDYTAARARTKSPSEKSLRDIVQVETASVLLCFATGCA